MQEGHATLLSVPSTLRLSQRRPQLRPTRCQPIHLPVERELAGARLPRRSGSSHSWLMTTTDIDRATQQTTRIRPVIVTLALLPIAFLLATVLVSIAIGFTTTDAALVEAQTRAAVPQVLLTTQILLLALLAWRLRRERLTLAAIGWRRPSIQNLVIGIALGGLIGIAYITAIAPVLGFLQANVGDYVPAGEMLEAYTSNLVLFFIANVLLAPAVEESLYRGYALPRLSSRWGAGVAVVVSAVFFGLLHWAGGGWYMLATGLIVGVPFAILSLRAKSVVPAFAAHLVLNLIEFVAVASG